MKTTVQAADGSSSHKTALRRFAATCLFLLSLSVVTPALAQDVSGTWTTNYDPIEIEWDDSLNIYIGYYAYQNLSAKMGGNLNEEGVWEGYWIQKTSEITCSKNRDGSPYWGRFRIQFDGNRFLGLWNYCDRRLVNKPDFHWKGRRQ